MTRTKINTPKAESRGRVIIVSNRLPVNLSKTKTGYEIKRSAGGLIAALEPVHAKHRVAWVGALGGLGLQSKRAREITGKLRKTYAYHPVFLNRAEWQSYYSGFSNRALWPLFHYFTQNCFFEDKQWDAYKRVNEKFARAVLALASSDDLIWVHDFHLLLVPQLIRDKMPNARIGFFLHTPFPSSEIFRILPWREQVVEGLLGADLIAFHTYDYVRHFRSSLLRILGVESGMTSISYKSRGVTLAAIPVGADVEKIRSIRGQLKKKDIQPFNRAGDRRMKIMLGVDRLDYTKGIVNRLHAYHRFLTQHPKWRGKVELVQVLVPSRIEIAVYTRLKGTIDELTGRINAQFGRTDWVPIRCFFRQMDMNQLVSLYVRADVAVVTPLRDGMNLVAKEFVLAQDEENPGVLVLSEFCGAAAELSEALIVNPADEASLVEAYRRALEMTHEEAVKRFRAMVALLGKFSAENWGARFLEELATSTKKRHGVVEILDKNRQRALLHAWKEATRRALFLDYDGTLVDLVGLPDKAVPTQPIRKLVQKLSRDKKNTVMIVSGRPRELLWKWFGETGCLLCAEHGAWIWDGTRWHRTYQTIDRNWKKNIRDIMELYTMRTPGSLIEEKEDALAWHYRLCEPEFGSSQARDMVFNLEELIRGLPLQCMLGKKVVEVKHRDVKKSRAWDWMRSRGGKFDFIMALGDDRTDEDLFKALPPDAWSVHVGTHDSAARFRLDDPDQVRNVLGILSGK